MTDESYCEYLQNNNSESYNKGYENGEKAANLKLKNWVRENLERNAELQKRIAVRSKLAWYYFGHRNMLNNLLIEFGFHKYD